MTEQTTIGTITKTSHNMNAIQWFNSSNVILVGGNDADAQAFIDAAGITSSTQQDAVNTLVVGLKADSLWTKMIAIYPIVGGSATTHKYNLKDPRDLDAAYRITFAGAVTHDSNGITGDGSTGYGNSFYTDTANDFSAGSYISNTTWTGNGLWGATTFPRQTQQYAPNGFSFQSGVENYAGGTSSAGFNQISRSGGAGTNIIIRQNGVTASHVATDAGVSSGVQNILRRNWTGAPSDYVNANLRFMFFGTGLTTTDQENLETLVDAYQTSLSRNV